MGYRSTGGAEVSQASCCQNGGLSEALSRSGRKEEKVKLHDAPAADMQVEDRYHDLN